MKKNSFALLFDAILLLMVGTAGAYHVVADVPGMTLRPVAAASERPLDFQLQQACTAGNVEQATNLLAQGAAINGYDAKGHTPLILAASNGRIDIVRLLLDKGAKIDFQTKGSTALEEACGEDHSEVAQLLIDRGANCNPVGTKEDGEQTPLDGAARNGDITLMTILLKHGVDINYSNAWCTALSFAIDSCQWEAFEFLISKGANPNIPVAGVRGGFTPLMIIANSYQDSPPITYSVKLLLKAGADPDYRSKQRDGYTPLMCTSDHDLLQVAQLLIDAGADVNASQYQSKETALTIAGDHGFADMVALLEKNGAHGTDLHIIAHDKPNPTPSPARLWALAVGAMYVQRNDDDPCLLGEWSDRPPIAIQADLRGNWRITDATELRDRVAYLRVTGDRVKIQKEAADLAAMSETDFHSLLSSFSSNPQRQAHLQAERKAYLRWKDRTGLAMDLCSSVYLINHGYSANYLSEQDAWKLLFLVAGDAQKSFSSWSELGENFLDGQELVKGTRDPDYALCVQLLSNPQDPNSVWNECPWNTNLSKEN